ncbi:MC family mitochondrial carrier protein [Phakopsora pachyrhizi]|nr:MC family mitochondrial carrier protein [Phakopsora pachyrhizi]
MSGSEVNLVSQPAPSNQVAKDLFAGTVGGICQVVVGQPFDIVKVRLQSSNAYKVMSDAALQIFRDEGLKGFYKGTGLPLMGIGACVALQFGCLEACKRAFRDRNLSTNRNAQLSLGQMYLAGAAAGLGNSLISGPVEHIRIRLQAASRTQQLNRFLGPLDALKRIIKSDGILKGLYYGQCITIAREFHGYGMYFLGYEWLIERHMSKNNCSRKEISTGWAVLYGAGAGYSMWLSAYPLDQIKTRIQTDALPSQPSFRKYNGIIDCAQKIWCHEGLKGFLKGLTPTLIRSPLVNGATFAAFEFTMRILG